MITFPVPGHIKNRLIAIEREKMSDCQSDREKTAGCECKKETVILRASERARRLQSRKLNLKTATPMREKERDKESQRQRKTD
jgi:hypothetical protein